MSEGNKGGGGFVVMVIVKLVILVILIVGVYIGYKKISRDKQRAKEFNAIQASFSQGQWQKVIDGYEAYWQKYPVSRGKHGDQVSQCYQMKADDKYQVALRMKKEKRLKVYQEVVPILEKAQEYGKLSEASLISLCDCYIDLEQYQKAQEVVKEAESREDIPNARFSIQKAFLVRREK